MREKIIKAIMDNLGYSIIWNENMDKIVKALLELFAEIEKKPKIPEPD